MQKPIFMHTISIEMNYENYDPCFPDQLVVDRYLPIWANQPFFHSKPAFIWAEDGLPTDSSYSSLTYSELNTSVQSISTCLLTQVNSRDTVLILCPPGLQLVQVLFGCQRAGLCSVPISPPDPSFAKHNYHHLVRVILQTNPFAAIASQAYIASLQKYISSSTKDRKLSDLLNKLKWISVDELENHTNSDLSSSPYRGCNTEDVYLIQYTSGATAVPKPVLVTAGAAAHNVRIARKAYDLHPSSVIVSWLPQYHDCGLMFLLLTVITGSTCVLTSPNTFVNRPRIWLELISKFKATCTPVPSFTLPLVLRRGGVDRGSSAISLWSLRNLIIINEPIHRETIEEFVNEFSPLGLNPSSISPSYGLAENCTFVSTSWKCSEPVNENFPNIPSYKKLIPSARLVSEDNEEEDASIIVVNQETLEPVEDGMEGEIWVASPSNASGYLGYPSLTREVFQARLRGSLSQCYVRTGDRGVVRGQERYLYVMGRISDVINVESVGEIHPHFIETVAYKSSPKLLRGGCIAALGVSKRIVILAEMQRDEGDVRVLRRLCENIRDTVLKEEKVEVGSVMLVKSGSLPKTTSGKIQRWIAKDKLMRKELRIIAEVHFNSGPNPKPNHASMVKGKESKGAGNMAVMDREEVFLSSSNRSGRVGLLSFL